MRKYKWHPRKDPTDQRPKAEPTAEQLTQNDEPLTLSEVSETFDHTDAEFDAIASLNVGERLALPLESNVEFSLPAGIDGELERVE